MAEFVELRLEDMLEELEEMQRVQLFSEQEIKAVIKKRRDFEYKLQKRTKNKQDYLKYIQYEINLLTLVRMRRYKIDYHFKKPEIDWAISGRINKLFMFVIARFPSDLKLWLSHIEFCKRMKWTSSISRIFVRLLAVKSNEPSLWIMAAKWEFEENSSASNARGLLLRALRFHPESIPIYTEAFRLELLEADRLRKRREVLGLSCEAELPSDEEQKNDILDGKLAVLFYKDAKKMDISAADLLPFLVVAKQFDFTTELQQTILSDMKEEHSQDEVTWDTIARNILEKSSTNSHLKLKDRVDLCCSTYEESVERLDTAKMWQLYADTLFTLYDNHVIRPKVRVRLYDVCNRAFKVEKLTSEYVIKWVQLIKTDALSGYPLKSILEDAVQQFPKSSRLWVMLMKTVLEGKDDAPIFCIDTGNNDEPMAEDPSPTKEIPSFFWQGIKALGNSEDAIPLWKVLLEHFINIIDKDNPSSLETVEELYTKALQAEPPVCSHFKPRFLDWIAHHKGLDEARRFHKAQATQPPLVIEFHYKMIELELAEKSPCIEMIRQVMDKAAAQFGQQNSDVWLRYIQFELDHGDASRVGNLHYRAKLTLDSTLTDRFLTQYTLMQLNA